MPFYMNLSHPGIGTQVSSIPGRFLSAEPPLDSNAALSEDQSSPGLGPWTLQWHLQGYGAFLEYMTPRLRGSVGLPWWLRR